MSTLPVFSSPISPVYDVPKPTVSKPSLLYCCTDKCFSVTQPDPLGLDIATYIVPCLDPSDPDSVPASDPKSKLNESRLVAINFELPAHLRKLREVITDNPNVSSSQICNLCNIDKLSFPDTNPEDIQIIVIISNLFRQQPRISDEGISKQLKIFYRGANPFKPNEYLRMKCLKKNKHRDEHTTKSKQWLEAVRPTLEKREREGDIAYAEELRASEQRQQNLPETVKQRIREKEIRHFKEIEQREQTRLTELKKQQVIASADERFASLMRLDGVGQRENNEAITEDCDSERVYDVIPEREYDVIPGNSHEGRSLERYQGLISPVLPEPNTYQRPNASVQVLQDPKLKKLLTRDAIVAGNPLYNTSTNSANSISSKSPVKVPVEYSYACTGFNHKSRLDGLHGEYIEMQSGVQTNKISPL
ncbi:MAG: hypothetical protein HAW66_04740 [Shewanella sp.]|nr:hypothetical protein [Shewanella sp.]